VAQQPSSEETERALSRIGHDRWSQLNWFVRLVNVGNFDEMTAGERLLWQEEFAVMMQPEPTGEKLHGYSALTNAETSVPLTMVDLDALGLYPRTIEEMKKVRESTAPHLRRLANGEDTYIGPFTLNYGVRFSHIHDRYGKMLVPRYNVQREEGGLRTLEEAYLLKLSWLLEGYAAQIRRCTHCRNIFLQSRRNQEYCGRGCQSVAAMRTNPKRVLARSKPTTVTRVSRTERTKHHGAKGR
jgi:hypothetical protein